MKSIPAHNLRRLLLLFALMCVDFTALNIGSVTQADDAVVDPVLVDSPDIKKFTNEELRKLAAPIALYPDALLAQVLPASTFPLQVVSAYRHSQSASDPTHPPAHVTWDSSVVALLNYPTILKKLNDDLDWTERLGMAVTYQMNELSDTIQQVRAEAQAAGNLVSNDKQTVVRETDVIRIVPTDPSMIYVPSYRPDVIFIAHDSWVPYISFGIGFGAGVWLDDYWDWHHHHFYRHHLWYSGGWYSLGRPTYWLAPYRPIPNWYRRQGPQPPVTGNRPGTLPPNTTHVRPTPTTPQPGPAVHPPPPHTPSAQPTRRPQGPAEGLGNSGQEVRRDSNRGQISRNNTPPTTRAPSAPSAPTVPQRSYSPPHQNVMRPSDGGTTRIESSRGAVSRGGSFGGGGGIPRRR